MPSRRGPSDWQRPLRNAGILLLGRGLQGVFSVAYLALAARDLGVTHFGMLVLLHTLVLSTAQFCRFQSWQAIMKFGAEALEAGDHSFFRRTVAFAFRLDLASALVALLLLCGGMPWLVNLLRLSIETDATARAYATLVFIAVIGSGPIGVLRLFDRHDLVSLQSAVEPTVRLFGVLACYHFDGDFSDYLFVWFLATAIGQSVSVVLAVRLLRARGLVPDLRTMAGRAESMPGGTWRFVCGTNVNGTLNISSTQVGVLLCGWLLGPAGAGYYRIASQFADVLVKSSSKLLVPAIYTDMVELTARNEPALRRQVVQRSIYVVGIVGSLVLISFVFAGKFLITVLVGQEFEPSYTPMLWLSVAGIVILLGFPFEPLLVASGRLRAVVCTRVAALAAYASAFYLLASSLGVVGAAVATTISAAVTTGLFYSFSRALLGPIQQEKTD